jgi:hypothetical protein
MHFERVARFSEFAWLVIPSDLARRRHRYAQVNELSCVSALYSTMGAT